MTGMQCTVNSQSLTLIIYLIRYGTQQYFTNIGLIEWQSHFSKYCFQRFSACICDSSWWVEINWISWLDSPRTCSHSLWVKGQLNRYSTVITHRTGALMTQWNRHLYRNDMIACLVVVFMFLFMRKRFHWWIKKKLISACAVIRQEWMTARGRDRERGRWVT